MTVVGPGRRGVIVATPDPQRARREREWLKGEGIPAVVPAELGLHLKSFVQATTGTVNDPIHLASAWSRAVRRPAVASVDNTRVYASGPSRGTTADRTEAVEFLRTAVAEPSRPRVAVFGGAWIGEAEAEYQEARKLGRALADSGVEIVSGGYQGVMAAVSRGHAEGGAGVSVGITIEPWSERVAVNEWLSHEVEAVDLMARLPVICDAEAWVAFPGGVGTLSEVALCWNLVQTESVEPRPLVIVGERWDRALRVFRELLTAEDVHFDLVRPAATADETMRLLGPIVKR